MRVEASINSTVAHGENHSSAGPAGVPRSGRRMPPGTGRERYAKPQWPGARGLAPFLLRWQQGPFVAEVISLTGVVLTTPPRGDRECRIGHRPVVSDVGDRLHSFN